MGWRETLVRGVAIGEAEIERERQMARVALKWPPADRIALARDLLAGTGWTGVFRATSRAKAAMLGDEG